MSADFSELTPEEKAELDAQTPQEVLSWAQELPVGSQHRTRLILYSLLEIRLSAEIELLRHLVPS